MNIDNPDQPEDLTEESLEKAVIEAAPKNKGGWPKGKPRSAARAVSATAHAEPVRATTRQRAVKGGQMQDKYAVPEHEIPPGMTYEWKNHTVMGKDNPGYNAFLRGQGFDPVPAGRHPDMVGDKTPPNDPIIRDGMILMERPVELTREAMEEDRRNARAVVAAKEEQLRGAPAGEFPRHRSDGSSTVSINRTVERGGPIMVE